MRLCLSSSVCIWNFKYVQRVRLWWHAIDQGPQLFDHSLYQFLFVSLILPELREDVVLLTGVFHSAPRDRGKVNVTRCIYAIWFYWCFIILMVTSHPVNKQECFQDTEPWKFYSSTLTLGTGTEQKTLTDLSLLFGSIYMSSAIFKTFIISTVCYVAVFFFLNRPNKSKQKGTATVGKSQIQGHFFWFSKGIRYQKGTKMSSNDWQWL